MSESEWILAQIVEVERAKLLKRQSQAALEEWDRWFREVVGWKQDEEGTVYGKREAKTTKVFRDDVGA